MKIYLKPNVWDAGLDRIRWLYDEFEHVICCVSGGKDSTVLWNLTCIVAEERGRLPVKTMFIDQEAEWEATIDHIREIMTDPRTDPIWLQIPFKIFNATSPITPWLHAWEEDKEAEWMRPKEPDSWKVNRYGTDRFKELFAAFAKVEYPRQPVVMLGGVRTEESPARYLALTSYETYKGETWGRVMDKSTHQYTMYPLYDWNISDIWKAIHDHGWPYCRLYDYQYQYGIPVRNMRVSNIHHETAVVDLLFMQEIEPHTWGKATRRLSGINTVGQMQNDFFKPTELPPMFESWIEYRDYLLEHLILDPKIRETFRRQFASMDKSYTPEVLDALVRTEIACILVNDYHFTKLGVFSAAHLKDNLNRGKISGRKWG